MRSGASSWTATAQSAASCACRSIELSSLERSLFRCTAATIAAFELSSRFQTARASVRGTRAQAAASRALNAAR